MISPGEAIYYFEYLDHAKSFSDPKEIFKKPFKLWCTGKILTESEDFIAVVCSGTIGRKPNSSPSFEIIVKSAITKKEVIHIVD